MRNLPRLMLVTQCARMKPNFESALEAALRGGAPLIQLREKDLSENELLLLAKRAQNLCEEYNATLLLNGAPEIARALNVGLHLPEGAPLIQKFVLCGASVHSLESARRVAEQGADYLVFGSVFETQSHPDANPAGLEKLREVCGAVDVPVFAIGGITTQNAESCFAVGAYGIAVIGAAWDAENIELAVRQLILCLPPSNCS
jgi:thiamine-phosphate pyrophosphorylase